MPGERGVKRAASATARGVEHGAKALAVALEGAFPGALPDKHFRLVISGTSKFATNEYFPYVSNGELSVAIITSAGDTLQISQGLPYAVVNILLAMILFVVLGRGSGMGKPK